MFDGSPAWSPDFAIAVAQSKGIGRPDVVEAHRQLSAALVPVSKQWTVDRLSTLLTTFTLGRQAPSAEQVAIWLSETTRLLGDLPEDILAEAIDGCVRQSRHGFLPSVGEIRQHANAPFAERQEQCQRLERMLDREWSASEERPVKLLIKGMDGAMPALQAEMRRDACERIDEIITDLGDLAK